MRRLPLLIALLLAWGCSRPQVEITGTILGADGRPPGAAHVHVTPISFFYSEPLTSVQADADGSFALRLDNPGAYTLFFTASNHTMFSVRVVLEETEQAVELNVNLKPLSYKDTFDDVRIVGDWNQGTAEPMTKQSDGTFRYERETTAETLSYQLLGLTTSEVSVNGTLSDRFEYNDAPYYRSVIKVTDGTARVVFDPRQLLRAEDPQLPRAAFDAAHAHLERMSSIYEEFKQLVPQFNQARTAYRKEHGNTEGFSFNWDASRSRLTAMMSSDQHPLARQFAAVILSNYVFAYSLPALDPDADASDILELASPSSPLWGMSPLLPAYLALQLNPDNPDSLVMHFVDQNPDRRVGATLLGYLLGRASRQEDTVKVSTLYARLKEQYGDMKEGQPDLKRYNPDRAIAVGKVAPDFEVKLMGSGEMVSNISLLGQTYLLDFWAVWCGPCIGEMASMHAAYEKFEDRGLTILSLSFDAKPEDVTVFREEKWAMPWLHSFLPDGLQHPVSKTFEVWGIPKPVLVGPDGTILATEGELRGGKLEVTLAKYLGEPGAI